MKKKETQAGSPGGRFLVKTEPTSYAFADLVRDGRTTWDGVKNAAALKHLRSMQAGDFVLVYHTGDERAVVGLARAVSDARPDPKDPALAIVDLAPEGALARPVSLAAVKADPRFSDLALVRMGRLSVMSVPGPLFDALVEMGGGLAPGR